MKVWVFRHAKSSWSEPGQTDFDRPLSERGARDALRVQTWLTKQPDLPQILFVSNARRTRETAEYIRRGCGLEASALLLDPGMYLANPEDLLDTLASIPEKITSAGLVGHNPSCAQFVNLMVGSMVIDHLPTLGIVQLALPDIPAGAGKARAFGQAEFEGLTTPKMLRNQ